MDVKQHSAKHYTLLELRTTLSGTFLHMVLKVHRNQGLVGTTIQRWLVVCCFASTETVGLLGTEAQDGHLDFHTAPEL